MISEANLEKTMQAELVFKFNSCILTKDGA